MTEHLSQSLTEVHFQDHSMNFEVFNELVTGLPLLQSIRARINEISVQTVDISKFDQMCARDWVCLGLKKLQLGSQLTQGIPTVKGDSWKQSLPKRCMDYMFSQFAKLEQLEEWDFVAGPVDLFILGTGGYLRQLSDLKSLKKIGLGPRTVYRMGAKEAEWVAENWTSLEYVDLACDGIHVHIMDISRVKADKLALDTRCAGVYAAMKWITFSISATESSVAPVLDQCPNLTSFAMDVFSHRGDTREEVVTTVIHKLEQGRLPRLDGLGLTSNVQDYDLVSCLRARHVHGGGSGLHRDPFWSACICGAPAQVGHAPDLAAEGVLRG
ncbi:hypothetical protein BGZ82_002674 [Podila clonocystis]|nr:hypothetical protein BGZ82_002674 [Podila clonocystis]